LSDVDRELVKSFVAFLAVICLVTALGISLGLGARQMRPDAQRQEPLKGPP